MDNAVVAVAERAKGFMPVDEGRALWSAGVQAAAVGPLLEIGSYCGKSACYLGDAARQGNTVLFTVDHHRGSDENQAGWEHHDPEVVDPKSGRMDTLPFLRRTLEAAGLESVVVPIVGASTMVAKFWNTPLGLCFIDGGHAEDIAMADYDAWAQHVAPGGVLVVHDVFEEPADGGQAPFHVWQRAVSDGFEPWSTTGSLRVLVAH
ncbi:MAG: class I SAM-dependent methyltransferase [Acidimicrobiia bacterium]